ncbi:high-affinity ammonium transporter [Cladophialophora carrionii]|uniref:High-affinity ammonium transporter n=1 Tax=Cladophialophora carrionii TaxID=86049 RepID=A0A1C1CWE8_9EURO|nr:high-affinity ammonium transporter [Cladophialophora carrionii]
MATDEVFTFGPVPAAPQKNGADVGWMMVSSALVLLMIAGLCLHFSGISRPQTTLTLVRLPLITTAVVGCIWYTWGYSLAFSPATFSNDTFAGISWYGGDMKANAYLDITARPVGIQGPDSSSMTGPKIPEMVYVFYQGMFACFTASLVAGGAAGKMRVGRFLLFITLWVTLVYCPVARWTWHPQGWSKLRGAMDFAGGTAVHVCSGSSVAAFAVFAQIEARNWTASVTFGNRMVKLDVKTWRIWRWISSSPLPRGTEVELTATPPETVSGVHGIVPTPQQQPSTPSPESDLEIQQAQLPYSINHMVLGTALLWIGWFGFNGGSALGANLRAVSACLATQTAACAGGTVGLLLQWGLSRLDRMAVDPAQLFHTPSMQEFCDGVIAGLVAITPAAGYVPVKYASIFGVVGAVVCKILRMIFNTFLLREDRLSVFAVHAGGGATGMLLTAFFAKYALIESSLERDEKLTTVVLAMQPLASTGTVDLWTERWVLAFGKDIHCAQTIIR